LFIDVFASVNLPWGGPIGMTINQGILYVTTNPPSIQRFDAATGVNTGHFVPSLPNPVAVDAKVNPANNRLYALYYNDATVETFDLTTMASQGLLFPSGSGGLFTPISMAFGPDGNLYIAGGVSPTGVRRYNPMTGAFIDVFANMGSDYALGIAFGPDNNLYVASASHTTGAASVMRFNYPSGSSMGFFIPTS